ncbi:hypothetical protein FZO89_01220 [Luteimonas viscosa]|uniref:Transmembrane protein n=1 Tax=Luteimonas viscosa TaxID=1132694 RepID=A0A5D4XKE0_9GAMM|nr:hypothetical protein [Luteimonas viscosa]TYT25009.1 hypothetical protein FZO89_01220 [Luteimonas viscosa]
MNLPLHSGWPGVMESALIAFAIGMLCFGFWRWLCRRAGWGEARAIGWACVSAIAIAAGIDSWNLFYLGVVRLESPLYARVALAKMHDPDFLGARVFMAWAGALCGVVAAWALLQRRKRASP